MGFNKLFIPEIDDLKEQLKRKGNEEFTRFWERRYFKADALIGPAESMDFLKQFLDREYNYRNNNQISGANQV